MELIIFADSVSVNLFEYKIYYLIEENCKMKNEAFKMTVITDLFQEQIIYWTFSYTSHTDHRCIMSDGKSQNHWFQKHYSTQSVRKDHKTL